MGKKIYFESVDVIDNYDKSGFSFRYLGLPIRCRVMSLISETSEIPPTLSELLAKKAGDKCRSEL